MDFKEAVKQIQILEGALSNEEFDNGGLTNFGITQKTYDTWRISQGLSSRSVADIFQSEIYQIYADWYWLPTGGGRLPDPLDFVVFQAGVNFGPQTAVKLLQTIVGSTVDGIMGSQTVARVDHYITVYGLQTLVDAFLAAQVDRYGQIVTKDITKYKFYQGWLNRVAEVKRLVGDSLLAAVGGAGSLVFLTLAGITAWKMAQSKGRTK